LFVIIYCYFCTATVITVQLLLFHNVSKYFLFIEHRGQPYASVKPCEGSREIATRHGRKSFESCDIQRCCKYDNS